ncbi:MAG: ISKra4 family transposase [Candidatus Bipolaricaulia bacterium]
MEQVQVHTPVALLEACYQHLADAEFRQRLHASFDDWLDDLEARMNEKAKQEQEEEEEEEGKVSRPSLEQMTQEILALRQGLTGRIAEEWVKHKYQEALDQKTATCPRCGRTLSARGPHRRTVETLVGEISLDRPYFYCVQCQEGFYPLDEELELSSHRKQADMQKAAASLAAEVPYETASQLFSELTGLSLSDHLTHEIVGELTEGLTVLEVSPSAEAIAQRVAEVAEGRTWRPIVVLAIDGADVPTRPETAKGRRPGRKHKRAKRARWQGEWREAKGFRFYLVNRERIVHLLSWHQVQSDAELAEALRQVKEAGLIPEEQVRLCAIADGAKWIWKQVNALFPSAVQVLDYYHCSEHLHHVAAAQFGDQPEQAAEWMEATVARLFFGEVDGIINDLERVEVQDEQAAEEIRKLIGYLGNNQERVDYGFARKGGYPIGSGGIESANKFISHVRLKRSGAWWYVEQANGMLALRCAKYNGTFDRVFELYKQRAREHPGRSP